MLSSWPDVGRGTAVADLGAEHDVRWTCAHHRRHDTASLPLWFIEVTTNTHFCCLNFELLFFIFFHSSSLFFSFFFWLLLLRTRLHHALRRLAINSTPLCFRRDGTRRGYCTPGRRWVAGGWGRAARLIPPQLCTKVFFFPLWRIRCEKFVSFFWIVDSLGLAFITTPFVVFPV